jgi:hypothetical protein
LSRTITLRHSNHSKGAERLYADENDTLYDLERQVAPGVLIYPSKQTKPSGHIGHIEMGFVFSTSAEGTAW